MRRIKKAEITHISLVPRGANQLPVIYKSHDNEDLGSLGLDTVVKATPDVGELTAIVYAAETRDAQGDIASADVIKQMAHDFQKRGGQIDIQHDGKALSREQAFVAESFLVQKGDPRFADLKDYNGAAVNTEGAWATVIKINDPDLRQLYRDGKWDGVSMAGRAAVVVEKDDEAPSWFTKAINKLLGRSVTTAEEIPVEKQEFIDVLKEQFSELAKALKPEEKKVEKTEPKTPEVDFSDAAQVEKHLASLKAEELKKGVDFNDAKQVEAYLTKLKGDKPEPKKDENPNAAEIAKLQKEIARLEGQSNQPDDPAPSNTMDTGLSKEMAEDWARGEKIAAFLNGESAAK